MDTCSHLKCNALSIFSRWRKEGHLRCTNWLTDSNSTSDLCSLPNMHKSAMCSAWNQLFKSWKYSQWIRFQLCWMIYNVLKIIMTFLYDLYMQGLYWSKQNNNKCWTVFGLKILEIENNMFQPNAGRKTNRNLFWSTFTLLPVTQQVSSLLSILGLLTDISSFNKISFV